MIKIRNLSTLLIFIIGFLYFIISSNKNILSRYLISNYALKDGEFFLNMNSLDLLNYKLKLADNNLIPKLIIDSKGNKFYSYKKNEFSKNLSFIEIEELINNPPVFKNERLFIKNIINLLYELGINVIFINFKNSKISGEWDYRNKIIKLNLNLIESGTKNFTNVLNHEVIHIVQSCVNGNITSKPKLIGLKLNLDKQKKHLLSSKIYKNKSKKILSFEKEAYSYQDDFNLGLKLLKKYCL